jgi:hypothetical protein
MGGYDRLDDGQAEARAAAIGGIGRIREFTRSPISQPARSQRAGLSVNSLDFARSSSSYRGRHG